MARARKLVSWFNRLACLLAGCTAVAQEAAPIRIRGIEGRIAIYASTNTPREAVTWVPAETMLTLDGELTDEPWVRIQPLDTISVWIYRELVRDGVVLADKSQVRSGAGMFFRPIASVDKGERVEVRGVYGDWLKIKPFPGLRFWVLRDQVEPLATPSDEVESPMPDVFTNILDALTNDTPARASSNNLSAPPPQETCPAPVLGSNLPPELSGFVLEETDKQGEDVVLTGTLDWGGVSSVSAPFCLVKRQPDGDTMPVCYLLAPELTYGPYIGASVTIEGTRWHVKGANLPFVIPRSLRISE